MCADLFPFGDSTFGRLSHNVPNATNLLFQDPNFPTELVTSPVIFPSADLQYNLTPFKALSSAIQLSGLSSSTFGRRIVAPGNTKGGSITVPLTSCLTGLDKSLLQIKTKIASCHADDSKPVKQEVNSTVILLPLVFPGCLFANLSIGESEFLCKVHTGNTY
jgi:hypothetical protein